MASCMVAYIFASELTLMALLSATSRRYLGTLKWGRIHCFSNILGSILCK